MTMNLDKLIARAFPPRDEAFPRRRIWLSLESRLPAENTRFGFSRAGYRWGYRLAGIAAGLAVISVVMVFYLAPVPNRQPVSFDQVMHQSLQAESDLRNWVKANRPQAWTLNEPAIRALDAAISGARSRMRRNPEDSELMARAISYINWRTELLRELAHETG